LPLPILLPSNGDSDNNQLKAAAKETVTAVMATATATTINSKQQ
jgi:hypothetical protein